MTQHGSIKTIVTPNASVPPAKRLPVAQQSSSQVYHLPRGSPRRCSAFSRRKIAGVTLGKSDVKKDENTECRLGGLFFLVFVIFRRGGKGLGYSEDRAV